MLGRTLSHFEIEAKLGEGGMGEVYRAHDTRLKRKVALKVLPPAMAADPARLDRFQREAEAVAALNHPNIVTIYSVEEDRGIHFLTMELVEGHSLEQLIAKEPLPLERLFHIAVPLADALGAAHERGITHRDLKPANVMITDDGRVKVLDFGLAKLLERDAADIDLATQLPTRAITREGVVLGTLPYMSPEQIEGKPVDPRTDIFAFGIVLYEMATGRRPFAGDSGPGLMSSILKDVPAPLTEMRHELPRHLSRIVQQSLEKDPDRRFQTAKDLRNQLDALSHEVASGELPPTSGAAIASEPRRRATLPWVVLGSVAVVLAALAVVYALRGQRAEPPGPAAAAVAAPAAKKMLAVLPFENLSSDPEQEYFSDGLTEEMIAALGPIDPQRLGVIARTSVMRFKGTQKPIDQVAQELGVEYLLTGSIRRGGERVRITAQLVQASDQTNLWAASYERTMADVLTIQSEVARAIADELAVELLPAQRARLLNPAAVDPRAYELHLKARHLWGQRNDAALRKAIALFEQALEIAPDYAPAWAGLADAWSVLPWYGNVSPEEMMRNAKPAAQRALELDPGLAEAHASVAEVELNGGDVKAALTSLRRAIELNPNYATAHQWYSEALMSIRRDEQALEAALEASQLDPLSAVIRGALGQALYLNGRFEDSADAFHEAIELNPTFPWGHFNLIGVLAYLGHYERAREALRRYEGIVDADSASDHEAIGVWRIVIDGLADPSARDATIELLDAHERRPGENLTTLGMAYAWLDRPDEAFDLYERAVDHHELQMGNLRLFLPSLRHEDDPRLVRLVERLGLTDD